MNVQKKRAMFISAMILIVLLIAFFVLKPEFDKNSDLIVKEEQTQKDESKETNQNDEQKEVENESVKDDVKYDVEDESVKDKTLEEKDSSQALKEKIEDEIKKKTNAQIEERNKTKKRLDEQLEIISKNYTENFSEAINKTKEEYLNLKETPNVDYKTMNKLLEEKSLEIGKIYSEASFKIIETEFKNAFADYKDYEKWKKSFDKTYEDGMKLLLDLHVETSKKLLNNPNKEIEENTESQNTSNE